VVEFSEFFRKPRRMQRWRGRQLGDDPVGHPMHLGVCASYLRLDHHVQAAAGGCGSMGHWLHLEWQILLAVDVAAIV